MIEARAIRRLAAMDIQVWHTRVPKRADGEKRSRPNLPSRAQARQARRRKNLRCRPGASGSRLAAAVGCW